MNFKLFFKKIRFSNFVWDFWIFFQKCDSWCEKWNLTTLSDVTKRFNFHYFLMIFGANESWELVLSNTGKRLSVTHVCNHVSVFKRAKKKVKISFFRWDSKIGAFKPGLCPITFLTSDSERATNFTYVTILVCVHSS